MSLTLLHGDHIAQSRDALVKQLDHFRQKNLTISTLEANTQLTVAQLESLLGSQNMFELDKVIVIEGLLGLPRSAKKTTLIELLQKFRANTIILLWEGKKATAAQIKSVTPDAQESFNLSSALFSWLDQLQGPKPKKIQLLHEAIKSDTAELCFLMLARQVRLYLKIATGGTLKEHPFVIKKASAQAKKYSLEQLKNLHEQLLMIDIGQKTGTSLLTLQQELEELMLRM